MIKRNPYTLMFGIEPPQFITRPLPSALVLDAFQNDTGSQMIYVVTGVRGSGKTVFLTEISRKIREWEDWIVVELNPDRQLLESLAAKLSSENALAKIFKSAKINLSFFGFGLEVSGSAPITDIETALSRMLESLKKNGKKLLITIDEVVSTPDLRAFASAFQIFVRQGLPVYLLMAGLYENVQSLQNEKSLTFLYRAPKIELTPLNQRMMANSYRKTLGITYEKALEMAKLTRGYPFAFQVLGYFSWEAGEYSEEVLDTFRLYLEEYAYEKIWSELSPEDRRVALAVAETDTGKISEIREKLHMTSNQFNPYRMRLIRKGLLNGDERGYVRFVLPLFEDFIMDNSL